jgi:Sigma-70 region 2
MSSSFQFLISQEDELALHKRLVDGDVTAPVELATIYIDGLIKLLIDKNSWKVPEELCVEAAEDAWIALVKNPNSFNPEKGKRLGNYLSMSAQGDLRNRLRDEGRKRGKSLEVVQLSVNEGKLLETTDDPSLPLRIQEEMEQVREGFIPIVSDGLSDGESRVLDLIMQGERKATVYAQALGIDHLPKKEKTNEVNRVKNKIKKRIKRGITDDGHES